MRRILVLIVSLSMVFAFTCQVNAWSINEGKPEDLLDKSESLVRIMPWHENFNQADIDNDLFSISDWTYQTGEVDNPYGGRHYSTAREENVSVHDGLLDIKSQISVDNDGNVIPYSQYTGSITGYLGHSFYCNEIEIRAKVASGKGVSSLGFLCDDAGRLERYKEIDLFSYSNNTKLLTQAVYTPKFHGETDESQPKTWQSIIDDNEFHVYKLKWTKKYLEFYIDDKYVGIYDPADYTKEINPIDDEDVWPFTSFYHLVFRGSMRGSIAGELNTDGWTLTKVNEDSKEYETHTYVDYIKQYYYGKDYDLIRFKLTKPLVQKAYKKKKAKNLTVKFISAYNNNGSQVRVYKTKKDANKNKKYIASKTKNKHVMKIVVKNKKLKNKKKLYVRLRHSRIIYGLRFYTEWGKPKKVQIKK